MQKKKNLQSLKSKKNKKSINKNHACKSKKVKLNGGGNDLLWTKITPETIENWHSSQTDFFINKKRKTDDSFETVDNQWTMEPLVTLDGKTTFYWIFKKHNNNNYYIKRLTDGHYINGDMFSISEISKFSNRKLDAQLMGNVLQIETAITNGRVATYTHEEIKLLKEKANSVAHFIDNSNNRLANNKLANNRLANNRLANNRPAKKAKMNN
jgi:hypothetical protein